jgi:hypothetical protein
MAELLPVSSGPMWMNWEGATRGAAFAGHVGSALAAQRALHPEQPRREVAGHQARLLTRARPGGVFESTMVDDATGTEYPNRGVFVEIVENERFSWREENDMITTSTLEDLGGGRTRLVIHQTNVPAMYRSPEALEGFNASLDRMAAHLAEIPA